MKQQLFPAILLISLGTYFFLHQYNIPIIAQFDTWPAILIILGSAFLIIAYGKNKKENIFPGNILVGFGLHFHALSQADKWIEHWGMYTLIVGVAFLMKAQQTKQGLVPGIVMLVISFFAISTVTMPDWFNWLDLIFQTMEQFWPLILIIIGLVLLYKK
ncbi:LiaI-LiaF-like domain-containing protein [Halalkalibacillus halophilus]|uniref:LiaI-LiaF-like domain-containing protein n=1 Tax=Halalkalibacillus halophilus TaxID=392827 RepID=UPI0004199B9B|nr:DUF5668 domain-containing protein [Halalkalibacillus halophilus]